MQPSPKKQYSIKIKAFSTFYPTLLLASLIGTYLDLYFVGKNMYFFPIRPFEDIFTINIAFTLGGLPLFTLLLITFIKKMTFYRRWLFILLVSFLIANLEYQAERFGFFSHSEQWKHIYSFFGYFLFMTILWNFYRCSNMRK
ncbi:CBO0543 family protein [Peribacillus tepidiphilus]|uniref:CBO0543 family protein n=1 Tax=Peribacillus tepidiphilus TaxID=2652445 RepID=UPI003B848081